MSVTTRAIEVLLDARETKRMSAGMRAYVRELSARLPAIAPDIRLRTVERGENFSFVEQVEIPFASRRAQLVHFPTIFAPVLLPRRYVVTVHDLIHLRFPELFGRATAAYYSIFVRRLLHGAALVIVGDERTVADCERFFSLPAEKMRVVELGYDPRLLSTPARRGDRPYVLYVGNHRAHKNLPTLVAAWRSLPPAIELDLVFTGDNDLDLPPHVAGRHAFFLGELTAEKVAEQIGGAAAVVQPSLAEGFGLPVLEALVRRVPVIAAEEAYPHVFKDYVACFPARDAGALRSLLEEAATAPQRLRARAAEGEAVARTYTWDRFASAIATVYREALGVSLT